MKHRVGIIGKGNIGWAIKELLKNDYDIKQGDITDGFDARDIEQVRVFLKDVATDTLSMTTSTATPERRFCSSIDIPSLLKVFKISGSTSSRLLYFGLFLGAE